MWLSNGKADAWFPNFYISMSAKDAGHIYDTVHLDPY